MTARAHLGRAQWVGIAVRMDDGTTYAIEVTPEWESQISFTVERGEDFRTPWNLCADYKLTPELWVDARITGRAQYSVQWKPEQSTTPHPEIEPTMKAIEQ